MKNSIPARALSLALVSLLASAAAFAAQPKGDLDNSPFSSCEKFEKAGGSDAIKRSPYNSNLVFAHQLKQLRMAVGAFYHAEYKPSMTVEQADELGEGVSFSNFRDKAGHVVQGVNVGFGGGNSAQYYFKPDTLELMPIVVIDGSDCYKLGTEN